MKVYFRKDIEIRILEGYEIDLWKANHKSYHMQADKVYGEIVDGIQTTEIL